MNVPTGATLAEFGEERLLLGIRSWLARACPPAPQGIGDDCAVVPAGRVKRHLVTVDPVIRGRHFDDAVPVTAVAAKLLKRNVSDIAAMGGVPRHALVALAAPGDLPVAWLRGFYRALGRAALRYGIGIVGGDCAQTDGTLCLSLTLVGDAPPRPLLRTGARAGDLVFVTGTLGGSILGKHHRFTPRLAEGQWLASRPEVHSAIDVSDGLGKDLRALVPPGSHAVVDPRTLPLSPAAHALAARTGRHALDSAINDGEDYELLFTVDPRRLEAFVIAWHRRFATRLSCIARLEKQPHPGAPLTFAPALPGGVRPHGYEHFQ